MCVVRPGCCNDIIGVGGGKVFFIKLQTRVFQGVLLCRHMPIVFLTLILVCNYSLVELLLSEEKVLNPRLYHPMIMIFGSFRVTAVRVS